VGQAERKSAAEKIKKKKSIALKANISDLMNAFFNLLNGVPTKCLTPFFNIEEL